MKIKDITVYGILSKIINLWSQLELRALANIVSERGEYIIQSGPFKDMKFSRNVKPERNLPKLVGSYELELHETIESLIKQNFKCILNIGAAEGYYAVGLALRIPNCEVIAFEMDKQQAEICLETAIVNAVNNRVKILGKCSENLLREYCLDDALVIIDCEGAEIDILSKKNVLFMKKTWLLIELHDAIRPGISRTILERFQESHSIQFIQAAPRDANLYAKAQYLTNREKFLLTHENRLGVQEWAVIIPKM